MMEQSYIYEDMGNTKEALYFAQEAVALNDSNLEYQKRLAFLYITCGEYEESLACLKRLVETEPNRFYNWYAFSEMLMLIGEYDDAVIVLQKALLSHQRAELYYQLSNCYFNLKNESEGVVMLEKALKLDPSLSKDMQQKYPFIKEQVKKIKTKKK